MPTFINLLLSDVNELSSDVCVIGAGAAGLYLSSRLAQSGYDVILLEAGGRECVGPHEAGFQSIITQQPYPGACHGRLFGLGGSTPIWGGMLAPYGNNDLLMTDKKHDSAWRQIVKAVVNHQDRVLTHLGFKGPALFNEYPSFFLNEEVKKLHNSGLTTLAGLGLPFRYKNLIYLLNSASRVRVFYNAVVCSCNFEGSHVKNAVVNMLDGRKITVRAHRFVIAAGALESTRLMLELKEKLQVLKDRPRSALGCYLGDHLSLAIADVPPETTFEIIEKFAPRFDAGWMRSYRFLDSEKGVNSNRGFAHFIFHQRNEGFVLAKELLTSLQKRKKPKVSLQDLAKGSVGLLELGFKRYFQNRLHISKNTLVQLQLDVEQSPRLENKVSLSDVKDQHGRKILSIAWEINQADIDKIQGMAKSILARWTVAQMPKLVTRKNIGSIYKPHDAYHPVGTCRIGCDDAAVVDGRLKVLGLDNLWIASTAVLPSAGSANPTFSLFCLIEEMKESWRK